ncbi:MAG: hypothetical protein LBI27_00800, partial [Clostridiales bacterium]|nr:hypothetical protein [Clostridiales bacterium]
MMNRFKKMKFFVAFALFLGLFCVFGESVFAANLFNPENTAGLLNPESSLLPAISVEVGASDDPESVVTTLQVLFLISIISLAPSLLVLLTSFTRIVIVLSFTRQAMATQQMPPNQVLVGIALFLTLFIMAPQFQAINENAIQ